MTNEFKPAEILTEAIRHIRRTHMNTYSWSLTISDEEAIDILSKAIVESQTFGPFKSQLEEMLCR